MPELTDLNVAPYYDDFNADNNFVRTLFRPGFAIQARELTQLQSTLQNQIEQGFSHMFKDGTMVIPGACSYIGNEGVFFLKLENSFGGETIDVTQYVNRDNPVVLTGATNGVQFAVSQATAATTTEPATLFGIYIKGSGTTGFTRFVAGENLSANAAVQHGSTAFAADAESLTMSSTETTLGNDDSGDPILGTGTTGPVTGACTTAAISNGIYFVRGHFIEVQDQQIVVSKYHNKPSAKIGLTITETIVTPENDTTLLDNATGSSNYAAKGAHRLKITLTLSTIELDSTDDASFIEIIRVKNGVINKFARVTEYSIMEETLARRTFDESGNYTVRPFTFQLKESVTQSVGAETFTGVYAVGATTDDGNTAGDDLLSLQVSTGKAYVKGFEIEKIAPTFIDINKARDFENINASNTGFEVGNFVNITNLYGTPDVTFISGESTAFKEIALHDTATVTRGTKAGTQIGVARARTYQYASGTAGDQDAVYRLYLFDVRPLTIITLSDTPSPTILSVASNGGNRVVGNTSGASGYVYGGTTTGTTLALTNVVGTFSAGEKIELSDSAESDKLVENSSNADLTISKVVSPSFEQVRQVYMQDPDGGQDFTADVALSTVAVTSSFLDIDGTDDTGADQGDNIITEDENLPIALNAAATGGTGSFQRICRLQESEKNISLFRLAERPVKTLLTATNNGTSDTQFTIRRQFIVTTNSSGAVTISAGANETFLTHSEADFTISVLSSGTGSARQGDIVSASTGFSGGGTGTLTITNAAVFGTGAKLKIMTSLIKTSVVQKTKVTKLMKQCKVVPGSTDPFGTRPTDSIISLGRADVFRLMGVFESAADDTDAVAPTVSISNANGTFVRGEKITGNNSGATARLTTTSTPLQIVYTSGNKTFDATDTITGESSGATATVSAVTTGDKLVTSNYLLDTGQRDNYYDISRIQRRPGIPAPVGRLLIVYDYLEHSAGDVITVDSYSDVANQMDYVDIPTYSATKVDPDAPQPSGEYNLYNVLDFRPCLENISGAGTDESTVDEITASSFDFYHRQYDGTGASANNFLKPGSLVTADYEFYLPKRAVVDINARGQIVVSEGKSARNPSLPEGQDGAMRLGEMFIPAYTFKPSDVNFTREKNQRFTMKDIGKLQERISNLEYYTHLSLLERDAESFEVTDANGLNRFKAGFIVDAFQGHRVGDVQHPDYQCSIDQIDNELRPQVVNKDINLVEVATNDTERASIGYQKTGDLITLPYEEVPQIEQPYATRVERVCPVLLSNWVGQIQLDPNQDNWFETEIAPQLIVNVEGNYDTFTEANKNAIGTIFNAWQTTWSGTVASSSSASQQGDGSIITRTTNTVRTDQTRTGVRTDVVERIDFESAGTKVIARALLPYCRQKVINFEGFDFYPNTRLYPFFDNQAVEAHTEPLEGFSTNDASLIQGDSLITNPAGRIKGVFTIPDPKVEGNPRFATGEISFRLTSSDTNIVSVDPQTAGEATYHAAGILETEQETIIATRNAELRRTSVTESTSIFSNSVSTNLTPAPGRQPAQQNFDDAQAGDGGDPGGGDPLAQTFMIDASGGPGGVFLTSVDIFFSAKDDVLPVTLELRNVINGYPGPKLLPFGRVVKDPADITIDETGQIATNFKFASPVYVQEGFEYCVCLLANVPTHKVWIARMGETSIADSLTAAEVGGAATDTTNVLFSERTVSDQPELGVMFKSHNNRTWAPSLMEDMKLTVYRANFTSATGTATFQNDFHEFAMDNVRWGSPYLGGPGKQGRRTRGTRLGSQWGGGYYGPSRKLENNPLILLDGSNIIQVKHPNHQMHTTANNVMFSDIKSGAETTLAADLTVSDTTITLTDGTNFDDTTGKFAYGAGNAWLIRINNEVIRYTSISGNTITGATRGVGADTEGVSGAIHSSGDVVELYLIHKIPLTELYGFSTQTGLDNRIGANGIKGIGNIGIDSYTVQVTTSAVIDGTGTTRAQVGGDNIYVSENILFDLAQFNIQNMQLPGTSITAAIQPTTATSPSGTQTSFTKIAKADEVPISINDNEFFDVPYMVCSKFNEDQELAGQKSLTVNLSMASSQVNLSPVIDTARMNVFAIANRINNVDSSSDVYPTSDYVTSTEPDGDNNVAIYCTRKAPLENAATALKVFFSANRDNDSEIKVLYKVLRSDDASDFDELTWRFFNDTGDPDLTVNPSLGRDDFSEYLFTAGVTDDGLGTPLEPFISFAVKIVMQSTNSAEPPRIKDFRALALAT